MNQNPVINYRPNPLLPTKETKKIDLVVVGEIPLLEAMQQAGFEKASLKIHAYVNGQMVPRSEWATFKIKSTDKIDVAQYTDGGDDSNPFQVVAQIAVIALAIAVPSLIPGLTKVQSALLSAGIAVAGNLLVSAIFPPKVPTLESQEAPEREFTISGARNRARQGQPLPLVVGTHKMAPDVGSGPYTTQNSEDVFLEQIFNFGYGDLNITDLKIGQTPVSSYSNLQTQFDDANDNITLVAGNVTSQAGGALEPDSAFTIRTTDPNTTKIEVDLTGRLFQTNDSGEYVRNTVTIQLEYREVGTTTWQPFFPPGSGSPVQRFGYEPDLTGPAGSFGVSTVQLSNDEPRSVRRTFDVDVSEGQYEVRAKRITPEFTNPRKIGDITWAQLKSYEPDTASYEKQTRLGVRIQASGQLNGTIDTLNAIVSAKIPVFDFTFNTFVTQESSNPAWIFYYLAKGQRDDEGRRLWGLGYTDDQIDIDKLKEWAQWCDENELECNYVFQNSITTYEMLQLVARCGRASPTFQAGSLGVVFDQENRPIVQRFGMSNILQNSFNVEYVTENLADEITVEFINKDADYTRDEVKVAVDDGTPSTPKRPVRLLIEGITDVEQAKKEANLIAARQFYHSKRVSFETDLEGLIVNRGDVIGISHDLTNWGASGNLVSGNTTTLTLDREITFEAGETYYAAVRTPEGVFETVEVTNPATGPDVETDTLTLATSLPFNVDADTEYEPYDYLWFFDFLATPGEKFKIVDVDPVNENTVRITAIPEVDAYYDSSSNTVDYTAPTFNRRIDPPAVENVSISEIFFGESQPLEINIRWELDNAQGARVRYRLNQGDWINYGDVRGTDAQFSLANWSDGDILYVELAPIALVNLVNADASTIVTYTIEGVPELADRVRIPNITGLELFEGANITTFTGKDAKFVWRKARATLDPLTGPPVGVESSGQDQFFKSYKVTIKNVDGSVRRTEFVKDESYIYSQEKNAEDGNGDAVREFRIEVVYQSTLGLVSEIPATLGVSNPPPAKPANVTAEAAFSQLSITADRPVDLDFAGTIVWMRETTADFTPTALDLVYKGPELAPTINTFAFDLDSTYRVKIAHFDGFGDTDLIISDLVAVNLNSASPAGIPKGPTLPAVADAEVGDYFLLLDDPVAGESTLYKLYSGTPNFWGKAIQDVDIQGLLDANNIPDLDSLNGQIAAGQVAANVIGANEIIAFSITANEIAANTITADEIAANTITGVEIAADTIGANEINFNTAFGEELFASNAFVQALAAESLDLGPIIFDDAGNARVDSVLSLSGSGEIKSGKTAFSDDTNGGFIIEYNGGTPRFKFGGGTGSQISWDGTTLDVRGELNADDIIAGTISADIIDIDGITLENDAGTLKISNDGVGTAQIAALSITEAEIADLAVSTAKLQDAVITSAKILDGEITTAKIDDLAVTTGKIGDLDVTSLKIAGEAVTQAEFSERTTSFTTTPTVGTVTDISGIVVPSVGPLGTESVNVGVTWSALVNSDVASPPNVTWEIRRTETSTGGSGTATIFSETLAAGWKGASWSYAIDDDVLPGTYTYALRCSTSSNRTIFRASLEVNFFKK